MKRTKSPKTGSSKTDRSARRPAIARSMSPAATKCAAIFRNGSNQAVRLPQDLRFSDDVKEVSIRKQGDTLVISPIKKDWASFFAAAVDVPDNFMADRADLPPQSRESL